ncbi:MAG: hypothetical protein ACRD8Z_19340 [Nitrososphaeraceae archaeon]
MDDPYIYFTDNEISTWKGYFKYFQNLCLHARNKTLNEREVSYLSYFVKHPKSSAYEIEPARKTNQSNYRYAKLALSKFLRLKLIKVVKLEKKKKNQRHPSKKCSLTDHGIFFLVSRTKISRTELLQNLFKNYHNLDIFQYLVYPYINLETICSPRFDFHFLAGVGKYLVNSIQRMDEIVSRIDKIDRSDKEVYFWNYNKLEGYLKKSFSYKFIDYLYSEEDFNDEYQQIRYFDEKNKNHYVTIQYNKKSKKIHIPRENKKIRKYEIPFATDYITIKVITYEIYIARYFHTLCGPKVEEFVLSVFPFFKVASEGNIRDLIANDRLFRDALKSTKHTFDAWYDRITSFPNLSF